ncbi:hypothetical protein B7494_g266 [Chlorociboria aeruginascens]|nr:hypothetical protein B7494_g266 [Chlorociboria aeruginascens]
MEAQKLRYFLTFLDSEVIPDILFERVKKVGSTWGLDGNLVSNKSILAPRWLCDVLRKDYDRCLHKLSALSSRRLRRKDVRAQDIEATLFDILFTVIQAYPEPYTKILWNDDEAELWPLVESTCLPFLAVLSTSDIESHVSVKTNSPPSISILAKHALHLLANDESSRDRSLEIHVLQVVDELIHLLSKQDRDSWSQLERLYRAEVDRNVVASMEFTIASFYVHQPALLHHLVKSLKIAGFPRDQKWSAKQILARTQLVGASVALEAAGPSWSTLPITVQVLSAIQAIRDREFIFASRILRSVMDMDKFREKCWPYSRVAIVLGTQLVICYNATAKEKDGAVFAEELMKYIWDKQRISIPPSESVVSLARSRGDLQFFLAYTDSLIGSAGIGLKKQLTFWKARQITYFISASKKQPVFYRLWTGWTPRKLREPRMLLMHLKKVDITRFDGSEIMKLALQEYQQELQAYREYLGIFSITGPQLYYCRSIRERFPKASIPFVERIGAAIWERFQRLKEMPILEETFESPVVTKEPSRFHDSGIGSSLQRTDALPQSIPPARSRASKLSFNTTFDPSSAPLLDIPAEILAGKPYNCEWCGKDLKMEHPKRQWPQHIFADLRPYICIMKDCEVTASSFGSQIEYEQHLAAHEFINVLAYEICNHVEYDIHHLRQHCQSAHRAERITARGKPKRILRNLDTQQCPFCGEAPGAKNFVRHVSRQCEDVALSSLWQALDENEDEESVGSDEH